MVRFEFFRLLHYKTLKQRIVSCFCSILWSLLFSVKFRVRGGVGGALVKNQTFLKGANSAKL